MLPSKCFCNPLMQKQEGVCKAKNEFLLRLVRTPTVLRFPTVPESWMSILPFRLANMLSFCAVDVYNPSIQAGLSRNKWKARLSVLHCHCLAPHCFVLRCFATFAVMARGCAWVLCPRQSRSETGTGNDPNTQDECREKDRHG